MPIKILYERKYKGISEEEVYQDIQRAVAELQEESYKREHNENHPYQRSTHAALGRQTHN